MADKFNEIKPINNDESLSQSRMMDMWRESIEQAKQRRATVVAAADDEQDARTELEHKIRSGQAECPTCAKRTYKDESNDGGVSFKAPKSISSATVGSTVMSHEWEHVSAEEKDAKERNAVANSTVILERAVCPTCGKTYVSGGVTSTTKTETQSKPRSLLNQFGRLDARI